MKYPQTVIFNLGYFSLWCWLLLFWSPNLIHNDTVILFGVDFHSMSKTCASFWRGKTNVSAGSHTGTAGVVTVPGCLFPTHKPGPPEAVSPPQPRFTSSDTSSGLPRVAPSRLPWHLWACFPSPSAPLPHLVCLLSTLRGCRSAQRTIANILW